MSKPFFYRITAADFLAAVVTVPEAERSSWVLSLALDMVSGDIDKAKSQFAKDIITEAVEFSDKKRNAANKRWSKEDMQNDAVHMQNDAVHMHSNARSSNSNRSKYKGDFESVWSAYPNKAGKSLAQKKFTATVQSAEDESAIKLALDKYIAHLKIETWKKPQNGGTWFGQWRDWVDYEHVDTGSGELTPQQAQLNRQGVIY